MTSQAQSKPKPQLGRWPVGVLLAMLVACRAQSPWQLADAPKVGPDEQYRTGIEVGGDYWVWHCYEGHRVVIAQSSSSSSCIGVGPHPSIYRGACGAALPEEDRQGDTHAMPTTMMWPGSDAGPPLKAAP